jgi:hypothetical protein
LSRLVSLSPPTSFLITANPNKLFPYLARNFSALRNMANIAGLVSLSRRTCTAFCPTSEAIRVALDSPPTSIQHMRIDFCLHVHLSNQWFPKTSISSLFANLAVLDRLAVQVDDKAAST